MNNLKTFFAECTRTIDEKLERFVPTEQTEPRKLHRAIRWSLFAGGKRFRPALVLAVGEAFGARKENLLCTAAAIEMIHTYSLVHDDLPAMDDDDLRRGRVTCHRKFDEATAILAGDVLQTLAFQVVSEDKNLSAEIRIRLISELARAAGTPTGMVAGQQLDLQAEGKKISIEDLEKIHHSKTGAIICGAARAGAIISEASEAELETVSKFASKLGLLFQITDDLLDVTQTTAVLGKTAGKDSASAKATYPGFYGVEESGKLARRVCDEACAALQEIDKNTDLLCKLADFVLNRKS
jgi:geranylgeranyl pyrophosphate synthase